MIDLKADQDEIKEVLGNEYQDYNLVMATTFGLPIGDSYLRTKMQEIIDELGLQDIVFHSLRHTSVTYKLKLSGGDIKAVQGDSGHAQADMVTEVYDHILDEDRRKNAELMENAFYNKENLNPQMKAQDEGKIPKGKYVIHANTPSYVGSHVTGFSNMTKAMDGGITGAMIPPAAMRPAERGTL